MFSHEKCLLLQEIIEHIGNHASIVGTTTYYHGDYKWYVNDREGIVYHHNNFILNYTITPEYYSSSVALLPVVDPWRAVPYFTVKLRECRGNDVILIHKRYSTEIQDINVSTDIIHDEDTFDSVCFQNSLLHENTDLYGIMFEPFARNLQIRGSRWQIYERIFNDDVDLRKVLELIKDKNPYRNSYE